MSETARTTVTVLGLGPMGRALVHALLDAGETVTVWNRTPSRAEPLLRQGARWAASAGEAVASSPVTLVTVVDHDAADAILSTAGPALEDRTVVGLTSDTPGRARTTAELITAHGGHYLDGAILTPAYTIGTSSASILLSGREELFTTVRPLLRKLATPTLLGDEPGRAAAFDVALLDLFWTTMSGYLHAMTLARAEGIAPNEFLPFAHGIREILPAIFDDLADRVEHGRHDDPTSTLDSVRSSLTHLVSASQDRGLDSAALDGLLRRVRDAEQAGYGQDEISRITDTLQHGRTAPASSPTGRRDPTAVSSR
ncbi:NAD(P)-binding domain-containing protein [Prauserella halophila]|uniref:NAD(P)-binding domain-containing protein n=1 Tax=Prauserella halophila TaxID=185641 RepID=A0ABN1W2V1_9PSEU|nr:NAD(P)-binding domain-containing protein [Prauserella halophila]MCP2235240.1 3-hydroxyisobutyrate dehydrogenase [Prauserella halophila]